MRGTLAGVAPTVAETPLAGTRVLVPTEMSNPKSIQRRHQSLRFGLFSKSKTLFTITAATLHESPSARL